MDIRSMVNSEDIPPPRRSSTTTAPANLEYGQSPIKSQTIYESQAPVHENRRDIRPPQPFALKTRGQDDFPSHSSYVHTGIQFPHQQIISLDLRGGNVPPGQNLSHSPSIGHQQPQYIQRESYPGPNQPSNRSFGNSTPLSQTPTSSTPGSTGGYTNFQRPSSSRSTTTPISAQHASSFLRESPQPANRQLRTSLQSQNGLHYMSQPSTPLGPPLTYSRPSLSIHSGSPVGHDHQRTLSGGSHGHQQVITPSSATSGSPLNHRGQYSRSSIPSNVSLRERGGSESISPKTRLSDLPQLHERESLSNNVHQSYSGVEPSKRKADRDTSELLTASSDLNKETSLKELSGDNSLLNAEVQLSETTCSESTEFSKYGPSKYISESDVKVLASTSLDTKPIYRPHLDTELHFNPPSSSFSRSAKPATSLVPASQVSTQPEIPSKALSYPSDMPPSLLRSDSIILHEQPRSFRISSTNDIADTTTLQNDVADQPNKADPFGNGVTLTSQPARKKPKLKHSGSEPMASVTQKSEADVSPPSSASTLKTKKRTLHAPRITTWEEVPVWAQSTKGPSRTKTLFVESLKRAAGQNLKVKPSRYVNITNIVQHDDNHTSTPQHLPLSSIQSVVDDGPLGHWEPSITNKIPYEEVGRLISDFMYREVVVKTDIGVGPAGGAANLGAIFEIEAKIGQLIDQNTNDRLALPVLNECVVSHNSNLRFRFESSMTETQHRMFNQFLNKLLVESQPTKSNNLTTPEPRVPISYKHTYETDMFYELTQAGMLQLPPLLAARLQSDRRSKSKVRITTDQKTGNVIAKIIKARIADIEVYSPNTPFDWRVSISVEMDYKGDMKELINPDRKDGKRADRNKDRMSYKHQAYQIDLTQVTPAEATSKTEKEHELEIEVSSAEVRKQGQLVQAGQPNDYEKLITTFVNNVRVLARHCR